MFDEKGMTGVLDPLEPPPGDCWGDMKELVPEMLNLDLAAEGLLSLAEDDPVRAAEVEEAA